MAALVERLAGSAAGNALRAPFALGDPNRMPEFEVDVRDWLRIVRIMLVEDLIETILRETDRALRPFVTVDE